MNEKHVLSRFERVLPAQHLLFEQGEVGTRMFVVRKGTVRIFRIVDGEEISLATLGPGEFFGEMALLEDLPRSASARTETPCLLIELDEPTFEEMIQVNSEIAMRMLRKLSARVRELDVRVQRLTADHGIGRAVELVRVLTVGGRVRRSHLVSELMEDAVCEPFEAELLVHDLLRARVLTTDGDDVVVSDASALDRFARYLELRDKYEGASNEVSDAAARRMARLIRALDKNPDEDEKGQTVLARHFREYLVMKAQFS